MGISLFLVSAFFVAAILYTVTLYNGLIRVRNEVERAWANIDILLKQRHDEIPKLLTTVEAYGQYEKSVIAQVVEARKQLQSANSPDAKAVASNQISGALTQFFAVAENYPNLKANTNFIQFQNRISGLEENISDRRELYNAAVVIYNIRIQQLPEVFLANQLGFTTKLLFQVPELDKQDPLIQFKAA